MQERINGMTYDVVVQWSVGDTVGVGIEAQDGRHLVDVLYSEYEQKIGELLAERFKQERGVDIHEGYTKANAITVLNQQLGRWVLDSVTGSTGSYNSLWTWLERGSTNRLIRLLRKARDFAFGKDE